MVFPMAQIMTTSTTGNNRRGFTLIEMAVVLAIIFILASSMILIIPKMELRASIRRAEADVSKIEAALQLHFQIRGWYPPDNVAHFVGYINNSKMNPPPTTNSAVPWLNKSKVKSPQSKTNNATTNNTTGFTAEEISNVLMIHFLTAAKEKEVFIEFKKGDLNEVGSWNTVSSSPVRVQLDPVYSYLNDSLMFNPSTFKDQMRAFTLNDPWGNVYVYDNNTGLPAIPNLFSAYTEPSSTAFGNPPTNGDPNLWFDGLPNNNQDFDLYSMGPNGKTALLSTGVGNSVDDSAPSKPDGSPSPANEPTAGSTNYNTNDKWDQSLYNGKERTLLGDVGDDINNFRTGQ